MIFWIILILLLLFLMWLLFAPLKLVIDTYEKKYYLELQYLIKISFVFKRAYIGIKFRVLFIPYEMDLIKKIAQSKAKEEKEKKAKKKKRMQANILVLVNRIFRLLKDNLNSFNLKYLHLGFDTGDHFKNAMLIPVLSSVNTDKIWMGVNFTGDYFLRLRIENRIYRLLFIWMKFGKDFRSYYK